MAVLSCLELGLFSLHYQFRLICFLDHQRRVSFRGHWRSSIHGSGNSFELEFPRSFSKENNISYCLREYTPLNL